MVNRCVLCFPEGELVVHANEKWRVILVNDADYPGFCRVIWHNHVAEMTDLSEADRIELMQVVWLVEKCIREVMQPDKINLASLGNMVPHIHWHIIPRYNGDKHFPDAIWAVPKREIEGEVTRSRMGKIPELRHYLAEQLQKRYGISRSS